MKNKSGLKPVEYKVLIRPVKVEQVSKGGIVLVSETTDKERYATIKGQLIDKGSIAFTDPHWGKVTPKIGDMVMYDRYAGGLVKGDDGEEYRLINDKEISAILEG